MYCQINDTKHTKTFVSRPFGNLLDLRLVSDLHFFLPTEHESVGKKNFFRSEAEKKNKLFHIDFDGSVRKPETRLFLGHRIALPCCGYSLE